VISSSDGSCPSRKTTKTLTISPLNGSGLEDIDSIFLVGGFVNFTNTEHAICIGLLPDVERGKVKKVGNAAIEGTGQALISKTKREEAEAVAKRIEHIKLEEKDKFMELFVSVLYFQKRLSPNFIIINMDT